MNPIVMVTLIAAAIGAGPGYLAWSASRKVDKISRAAAIKADEGNAQLNVAKIYQEAMDFARRSDREVVEGLRDEVGRLNSLVNILRDQVGKTDARNFELRETVAELQASLARLRSFVIQHGIKLPDLESDPTQ